MKERKVKTKSYASIFDVCPWGRVEREGFIGKHICWSQGNLAHFGLDPMVNSYHQWTRDPFQNKMTPKFTLWHTSLKNKALQGFEIFLQIALRNAWVSVWTEKCRRWTWTIFSCHREEALQPNRAMPFVHENGANLKGRYSLKLGQCE